jgi:hypothetical protein
MTDPDAALESALVDACLDASAGEAIVRDLRGFLESRGVAPEDVIAILQAPPRMAVYRALVRNGLSSVVARLMPRTQARMNATCEGRFNADFARFLHDVAPRTHYLRDVPSEFFEWIKPRWSADAHVPRYLVDLGAHELACFALTSAPDAPVPAAVGEVDLSRPAVLASSMKLVRYGWAVHELPEDPESPAMPERRNVALVGYRDPGHAIRWLELTPLAAHIVERLGAGDPVGAAIERACAELRAGADVTEVARLLADLGARGILLGGAAR